MGMLDPQAATPVAPQAAPQQGGMMAAPQGEQKGYNGVVTVQGKQVQVVNGIAEIEGQKYFATADGALVLDSKLQPIGYIENSEFHSTDAHHRQILKQLGYLK